MKTGDGSHERQNKTKKITARPARVLWSWRGPAEALQTAAAKALEQKDRLLEEERGGGAMEG